MPSLPAFAPPFGRLDTDTKAPQEQNKKMSSYAMRNDKKNRPSREENDQPEQKIYSSQRIRKEDAKYEMARMGADDIESLTGKRSFEGDGTATAVAPPHQSRKEPNRSPLDSGIAESTSNARNREDNNEYRGKGETQHERENRHRHDHDWKMTSSPFQRPREEHKAHEIEQHQRFKTGNHETRSSFSSTLTEQIQKIDRLEERKRQLKDQLEARQADVKNLEYRLRESERESRHLRVQLEAKEAQHAADRQLLEERTRELQCAQAFLSTVRSYSGRELIDLLEELNTEVLHAAASITDAVNFTLRHDNNSIDAQAHLAEARAILGHETVDVLLRSNRSSDAFPSVVQSVIQATILHHLNYMLNSWSIDDNRSRIMVETYESVRKHVEKISIAGRWKALAKAQSKYASYSAMENLIGNNTYQSIVSTLCVAGQWSKDFFDQQTEQRSELYNIIDRHLREILTRAGQLDKVLGEIIDEDWEVYFFRPGVPYDEVYMVDTYGTPDAPHPSAATVPKAHYNPQTPSVTIFCTTDLGLSKRGSGERQVMVKAKVLLQTTAMEGLNEVTSTTEFR